MMNTKIVAIFAFGVGAAIGALSAWKYAKRKYERIAQEEIDSVKDAFSKRDVAATNAKEKPSIKEYTEKLREHEYTNYSNTEHDEEREKKTAEEDKPYVISPDEFGENDEYESISLTYYDDQILADDNDDLIEDVEDIVGFESLGRFGEYEDDSVFVRNDRLKCDYEILKDQRKYLDATRRKRGRVED
ncbi:hypothetical protein FACS189490_11320 [Clostridia bacterium]|nr:hypothetical protein FACS189490_11320 [Clostridia bacterium]